MIGDLWFKNAVVYSVDVETFLDDDGDGCGDFAGLSRRLDYLDSLGGDAGWLGPPRPGRARTAPTATTSPPSTASTPATGRPATSSSSSTRPEAAASAS